MTMGLDARQTIPIIWELRQNFPNFDRRSDWNVRTMSFESKWEVIFYLGKIYIRIPPRGKNDLIKSQILARWAPCTNIVPWRRS